MMALEILCRILSLKGKFMNSHRNLLDIVILGLGIVNIYF